MLERRCVPARAAEETRQAAMKSAFGFRKRKLLDMALSFLLVGALSVAVMALWPPFKKDGVSKVD